MFLLYLDASGTADPKDGNSKHYVLVGLCMHEGTWFGLDKRIQALKGKYCFPGDDPELFELHVKQFAVSYKEQEEIANFEALSWTDRRSQVRALREQKLRAEKDPDKRRERRDRYRDTDPFVHLSRRERSQLLEDAIDVIAGHERIRLFGEGVYKIHPSVVNGHADPVPQSFTQVVARFDTFLRKKDNWKLQKSHRRSIDHGLLMLDQDPSTESMIAKLFRTLRERGHSFGAVTHVIDVPFFASSAKVGGLQLADVAAYVVRRYFDTGAKPGSHEERQFQKLFQRFDRDNYGKLHGLRHYIPQNTCSCIVCQDRGHAPAAVAPPPAAPAPPAPK